MPLSPSSRLLIIYYNFPPVKVPGAVRIRNFYQACLPYFDKVLALTTSNRRFFLQDAGLETGCPNIHEVPAYDLRWLSLRKKGGNKPYVDINLKERPIIHLVRRMVDSFPLNVLIGDGGLVYILRGYQKGKKLVEKEGVTHLFSTFRPYSDHIIAWLLKRRFPKLYWIADFRDLHVDPARKNVLWPAFQRWCNRQILHRADLATTVSEGLKQHLDRLAPRVYVLRNGIGIQKKKEEVQPFEKFTIVYTGALYEGLRDPNPLFYAIYRLIEKRLIDPTTISLLYAGPDQAYWLKCADQTGIKYIVNGLGVVDREESLRLQRKGNLNLLLTWASPNYTGVLSGKLFEYLEAGRPILALVEGSHDHELETILGHCKENAIFYPNELGQDQNLERFLYDNYRQWENSTEKLRLLDLAYLEQYSWQEQIKRIIQIFQENIPERD